MLWVLVVAALAVLGLVVVASYTVWLAHKLSDVWAEIRVLTERSARLFELLAQIGAPPPAARDTSGEYLRTAGGVAHVSTYDGSASAWPAPEKRKI
jgi:hypothetical protein